jgi:putative phosphoserine phosphatase/1-acylglycerol-3-phosphate O-acyltransferase
LSAGQIAAFFDMDKTIISENSGSIILRDSWERGELSNWDLARGAGAYLQYKLGVLNMEAWTVEMLRGLAGQLESELMETGRVLFEKRMVDKIYPEARRLIAEHLAKGHVVAIVSGSIRFLVEPLAVFLSVKHVLCTELETQDGVLTGRCVEPICFEEGKIYWLQGFIERHQIDLARSWFYTDSITDLPVLDLVGHPVATNPDPMLYLTANRRGWPIRIFEEPG